MSSQGESRFLQRSGWAKPFERIALAIEHPVNQLIGNTQLNPFYHTGTIALFLLGVVAVTGFYLFLFFQYGFEASYTAVLTRIETPILARTIRAVHRYASGALVITTLLHAFRMLFMERFKGPRRLAWITGIVMTFILWLDGITGYALVWDSRAQLINEQFISFLEQLTPYADRYQLYLLQIELNGRSWPFMFGILAIHVLLFLIVAGFFWLHIRHLQRPRWLPELIWMGGAGVVLLLISLIFPSGMLPRFDPTQLPGRVLLDPIYLYYLPLTGTVWANWLWGGMWLATAVFLLLPWAKWRGEQTPAVIEILEADCTGCTKCERDCPYAAIEMVPRNDDSGHQLLAVVDPAKCVGCGICVGSCDDFYAIQLGESAPTALKAEVSEQVQAMKLSHPDQPLKLIFTCRRHAAHGAAPYLESGANGETAVAVIPLSCTGSVQPTLLPHALEQGADEVEIVGCPPYDCNFRFGNMLEEQRVTNERVPRLRRKYDHDPITAVWLPPNSFAQALPLTPTPEAEEEGNDKPDYRSTRSMFEWLSLRNVLVGFVLLGIVLLAQIWFTGLAYAPYPDQPAFVEIGLQNPAGFVLRGESGRLLQASPQIQSDTIKLFLEIDQQPVWTHDYEADTFFAYMPEPIYERLDASTGTHHFLLYWVDPLTETRGVIANQTIDVEPGQIVRLHDRPDFIDPQRSNLIFEQ